MPKVITKCAHKCSASSTHQIFYNIENRQYIVNMKGIIGVVVMTESAIIFLYRDPCKPCTVQYWIGNVVFRIFSFYLCRATNMNASVWIYNKYYDNHQGLSRILWWKKWILSENFHSSSCCFTNAIVSISLVFTKPSKRDTVIFTTDCWNSCLVTSL